MNERLAGTLPVVAPDDPRVSQIATLIDELGRKNRQIDEKESEIVRLTRENEELRRAAIARTLTVAAQPDASPAAVAAATALEAGDTGPAEALLRSQEREEVAQIGSPEVDDTVVRRQAAALAREQGAFAMGHDVRTALQAYQRAAEYEPDDTWTHFFIGDLHMRLGNSKAAMQSYGQGAAAAERRLQVNPNDLDGQRDLSVSHNKIGDVLVAQGDGPGALAAYRKGSRSARRWPRAIRPTPEWQRDLSVSHSKIGDVLGGAGRRAGRRSRAYRKGLAIAEALAARDPANTEWQRDLSVSHNRIGDVLVAQGDGPGALAAYRKGLAIREALAARDPANTEWQRDLSVSHDRIGDVLNGAGRRARGARGVPQRARDRRGAGRARSGQHRVAARPLGEPQQDRRRAGGAGRRAGGARGYRKELAIREALAARDPANAQWQTDVAVSCAKLGTLEHGQDVDARRGYLLRGRDILVKLKEAGRLMPNQDWIGWFDEQIAQLRPGQE